MMMKYVVAAVAVLLAATVMTAGESTNSVQQQEAARLHGEVWAVLVAGSSGWFNYRHQADVCHAYQILHQHGVPDDHIIVMMYDDLAHSEDNPTPGVVINRPGGPDVYKGVPKDYTGEDVTPENFLKVLKGDTDGLRGVGTGRVLNSGPNDRVFINMVDHGSPGIFVFPNEYLNATDLVDTLLAMHGKHRYREMVLYVESCESGSLFQHLLPRDIEVYALSASSPHQHSYACYYDKKLGTFLGDVFSVKWMEDTDRENLHRESLKAQFQLVRKEVSTSTVMHWGELRMGRRKLSRFLGSKEPHQRPAPSRPALPTMKDACLNSSVASPDVPLAILQAKQRSATTVREQQLWQQQLDAIHHNRRFLKMVMWQLATEVTGDKQLASRMMSGHHKHDIVRWSCYLDSVRAFHTHCFNLTTNLYGLRVLDTLVNLCEHGHTAAQVLKATRTVCAHLPHITVL